MSGMAVQKKILPKGWREFRLSDIGTIYSGGTPATQDKENWDGNISWLTPSEVTKLRGKFISRTERTITKKGLTSTTLLPKRCLIVCTRATIGNCCINLVPMAVNQGFKCISLHKNYSVKFIYYAFQLLKKDLIRLSCGNTFGEVSQKDFGNITINIPILKEQKAITSLLETWDTAIEKTESLIAEKEKQFKWSLKRLIDDQQNNPEWRRVRLGRICKIQKGIQLNRLQMIENGKYPVLNGGIKPSGYTEKWNTTEHTITISEGGSCGYVNYVKQKFWSGGHCYSLLDLNSEVNSKFLYYQLKGKQQHIMKLRVGSCLPNIQKSDISNFPCILPASEQQLNIAFILDEFQYEIDLLKNLVKKYYIQKYDLIQKLLTGSCRIKINK